MTESVQWVDAVKIKIIIHEEDFFFNLYSPPLLSPTFSLCKLSTSGKYFIAQQASIVRSSAQEDTISLAIVESFCEVL